VQSLKNAMSTLGNSFAAAFAPIVSMVIPWLTQLINAIAKAISYIGQFFAILGGKNTFVRAKQIQDSYNSSLNKTGSAAKKAAGALAKFDDSGCAPEAGFIWRRSIRHAAERYV